MRAVAVGLCRAVGMGCRSGAVRVGQSGRFGLGRSNEVVRSVGERWVGQ